MLKAQTPNDPRETDASTAALIAIGLGCYLGWQTIDISPTLFPHLHRASKTPSSAGRTPVRRCSSCSSPPLRPMPGGAARF